MPVQGVMLRIPVATIWVFCLHPGNHQGSLKAHCLPVRVQQEIAVNKVRTLKDHRDLLYIFMLLQVIINNCQMCYNN